MTCYAHASGRPAVPLLPTPTQAPRSGDRLALGDSRGACRHGVISSALLTACAGRYAEQA